jgi:HK97 family phage major capsid protein
MPDIAAGKKPIAFSYYSIVDRAPISVSVLSEVFSATEQVGYLGHEYLDAKLLRNEAIKVIQVTE